MASHHCLEAGRKHVELRDFRLMLACAEVCEACAKSGEQVGDMEECVRAWRACAENRREMAA